MLMMKARYKLSDSDSSIFKDDVVFKYANDEDTIKRLCGLKQMPIVYYPCLTLGQAWNLIENLSAFLKYRHMGDLILFSKIEIYDWIKSLSQL